jgi:Uma2 family endonuclease
VKEYWIVDPAGREISVNLLKDGRYVPTLYKDHVRSFVLPGLVIDLQAVKAALTPQTSE